MSAAYLLVSIVLGTMFMMYFRYKMRQIGRGTYEMNGADWCLGIAFSILIGLSSSGAIFSTLYLVGILKL